MLQNAPAFTHKLGWSSEVARALFFFMGSVFFQGALFAVGLMSFLGFLKAKNQVEAAVANKFVQMNDLFDNHRMRVLFSVQNDTPKVRTPATSADVKLKPSGCLFWLKNHFAAQGSMHVFTGQQRRKPGWGMMFQSDTRCNCNFYFLLRIVGCLRGPKSELDNLLNGWIGALPQACPVCASHNAWWSRSS